MKRISSLLIVLLSISILLSLNFVTVQSENSGTSQISFINVGQGDAALIQDPHGFDILIDGGPTAAGSTVVDYLRAHGVTSLEVILNTHADADHVGGLVAVLQATDISVGTIYFNGYPGTTATWNNFVAAASSRSIPMVPAQFPAEYAWGDFSAYILNPSGGLSNPEQNDASVVARLDYNATRFLFPGDIDSTIEATVIARETPVAAQVLKVAHHGSAYSSSAAFLAAVDPNNGVISVGQNSYGHPAPETLNRLSAQNVQVWRTDQQGTIMVLSDGIQVAFPATPVGYAVYLPIVIRIDPPTPEPTETPATPTPPTPTPVTPTPVTPTPPPVVDVRITGIFADGAGSAEPDEYVQVQNHGLGVVQLQSWTLRDIANHVYTFPNFSMQPGQVCRVYTNMSVPAYCGFNYGSGAAIWNNGGDCAYLRNGQGQEVSQLCY